MCRSVVGDGLDCRAKLRNRSIQITRVSQTPAGVCRENSGLKVRFLFCQLDAKSRFGSRSLRITELTKDRCKSRVSAGEIRLEPYSFAQCICGFLEFCLLFENRAKGVEGFRVIRFRCDRFP